MVRGLQWEIFFRVRTSWGTYPHQLFHFYGRGWQNDICRGEKWNRDTSKKPFHNPRPWPLEWHIREDSRRHRDSGKTFHSVYPLMEQHIWGGSELTGEVLFCPGCNKLAKQARFQALFWLANSHFDIKSAGENAELGTQKRILRHKSCGSSIAHLQNRLFMFCGGLELVYHQVCAVIGLSLFSLCQKMIERRSILSFQEQNSSSTEIERHCSVVVGKKWKLALKCWGSLEIISGSTDQPLCASRLLQSAERSITAKKIIIFDVLAAPIRSNHAEKISKESQNSSEKHFCWSPTATLNLTASFYSWFAPWTCGFNHDDEQSLCSWWPLRATSIFAVLCFLMLPSLQTLFTLLPMTVVRFYHQGTCSAQRNAERINWKIEVVNWISYATQEHFRKRL